MDRIQNQMMDETQFREIMTTLNGIVEKIKQLENAVQKNSPTLVQKVQDLTGSKVGDLSHLPTIGRLTTK